MELTMALWRLIMAPWGLKMEPWRLTTALDAHHGAVEVPHGAVKAYHDVNVGSPWRCEVSPRAVKSKPVTSNDNENGNIQKWT